MKKYILLIFIVFLYNSCTRCDKVLWYGEAVLIPVNFSGFTLNEIHSIRCFRINHSNPAKVDSFLVSRTLFGEEGIHSEITDKSFDGGAYGDFGSYLDNSDLIISWPSGSDTLSNIIIKKSKGSGNKCHRDDPNIRVDVQTFMHKGQLIQKGEGIAITK